MRKSILLSTILAAFLAAGARNLQAQVGAVDTVSSTQRDRALQQSAKQAYKEGESAPEIYSGEASDVGPQSVIIIKPRRTLFEGVVDSQYLYTDNAFLQHNNPQKSGILISTAQIALAPTPYELCGGQAAPRIGYRQQWYDYFEYESHTPSFSANDFNVQTFFADERWMKGNWIVGVGFDYNRLLTTEDYDPFYSECVPRWEVQRDIPLCPQTTLSLAYLGWYHFTDAPIFQQPQDSFYDRLDQAFLATCNYNPCSQVIVQPYYAFKYTLFTSNINREDYLNSVGLGLYYFFCRSCSARAFVSYDNKCSTTDLAGYHRFGAGGGLNVTLRF